MLSESHNIKKINDFNKETFLAPKRIIHRLNSTKKTEDINSYELHAIYITLIIYIFRLFSIINDLC